jgi:hypothetical protein
MTELALDVLVDADFLKCLEDMPETLNLNGWEALGLGWRGSADAGCYPFGPVRDCDGTTMEVLAFTPSVGSHERPASGEEHAADVIHVALARGGRLDVPRRVLEGPLRAFREYIGGLNGGLNGILTHTDLQAIKTLRRRSQNRIHSVVMRRRRRGTVEALHRAVHPPHVLAERVAQAARQCFAGAGAGVVEAFLSELIAKFQKSSE